MHVLFENIAPQLMMSWRGGYKNEKDDKGKDKPDDRDFVYSDAAWEEIKAEVASSNTMVPSHFAPYVNLIDKKSYRTAELYCCFLIFPGPIILKDRLPDKYYRHFIKLSEITKAIIKIEITKVEVDSLRLEIVNWVQEFEK